MTSPSRGPYSSSLSVVKDLPCPACGVAAGRECRDRKGFLLRREGYHLSRVSAFHEWAKGSK